MYFLQIDLTVSICDLHLHTQSHVSWCVLVSEDYKKRIPSTSPERIWRPDKDKLMSTSPDWFNIHIIHFVVIVTQAT